MFVSFGRGYGSRRRGYNWSKFFLFFDVLPSFPRRAPKDYRNGGPIVSVCVCCLYCLFDLLWGFVYCRYLFISAFWVIAFNVMLPMALYSWYFGFFTFRWVSFSLSPGLVFWFLRCVSAFLVIGCDFVHSALIILSGIQPAYCFALRRFRFCTIRNSRNSSPCRFSPSVWFPDFAEYHFYARRIYVAHFVLCHWYVFLRVPAQRKCSACRASRILVLRFGLRVTGCVLYFFTRGFLLLQLLFYCVCAFREYRVGSCYNIIIDVSPYVLYIEFWQLMGAICMLARWIYHVWFRDVIALVFHVGIFVAV